MIGGRLLALDEVADELGCSVATVKRRARSGELPVYVDGRIVRVRQDDLRRYIAEHILRRMGSLTSSMEASRPMTKGQRLWD
jgi:excisionase family DNA binding protein